MTPYTPFRPSHCVLMFCALFAAFSVRPASAGPIRDQAAIDLTFDGGKASGTLPIKVGGRQFNAALSNGATTAASPFWAQQGKQALRLNAARKQFVQLTDVPFLDRPDAVSLSFFYLNLHNVGDAAFHGIVAKRSSDDRGTNYGVNFNLKNDALQLYVNDGGGFRTATYSARSVLGFRRLAHLTVTFEVADAPAPDADGDRDDVRVRLFLNGKQMKPAKVEKGAVAGNDAWLLDVAPAALLNDAPLTLGASTPAAEYASGLIDEFLLYTRALGPSEAGALFLEMAGANADALARQELETRPPVPSINTLSQNGLQLGTTTRLTITGRGLMPNARVDLPIAGLKQKVLVGSNGGRLIVELTLPNDPLPGYFPLRVQTDYGLSNALPVAVDDLPQRLASDTTAEKPATLPAAFSGSISGSQEGRVYFRGKAGQRVVADVEARRLGARLDPLLEIKTERGTPLAIQWGKVFLKGDTRAEVKLPADGLYYAELHDLSYKAPGRNPFRLILGDLKLIDTYFPPAVARGAGGEVEPVGSGIAPGTTVVAGAPDRESGRTGTVLLPRGSEPRRAVPPIRISDAVEVVESAGDTPQVIDARSGENKNLPIVINGRISQPNEQDLYLLDVTPGESLSLRLDARSIDSPLDGRLAVKLNGAVQIARDDRPGSRDPAFNYKVPANVKQIQLSVSDLYGRSGSHFLYRLRVIPAGQPDFSLRITTSKLSLPADGTAFLRLQLNRAGYNGPVKLHVLGIDGATITPREIPAGGGNRKLLVTLSRNGNAPPVGLQQLRIVGESAGLPIPIRRFAVVAAAPGQIVVPGFQDALPTAVTRPVSLKLNVGQTPQALLKALTAQVSVELAGTGESRALPVRLTVISTEAVRPIDPKAPAKGNKPKVRAMANQVIPAVATTGTLNIAVPADVADRSIEFVVRGDVLPHAYSSTVLASIYSAPFRLPVKEAVKVAIDAKTLNILGETQNKITGKVTRAKEFQGEIVLALGGLPKGYSASKVTVKPGSDTFEIVVKAPKENEKRPIPRVTFSVTDTRGRTLQPTRNLTLSVSPKPPGK